MTMSMAKDTIMTEQNHFILFGPKARPFHKKAHHFRPFHFRFEMVLASKKPRNRDHFTPFHRHKPKLKTRFSLKKMYIYMSEGLFFLTAKNILKLITTTTGTKAKSYDREVTVMTKRNTLRTHPATTLNNLGQAELANDRIECGYVTLLDILPKGTPPLKKHNKFYATLGGYDPQRNNEQIHQPYLDN